MKFTLTIIISWILCYPLALLLYIFWSIASNAIRYSNQEYFDSIPYFHQDEFFLSMTNVFMFLTVAIFSTIIYFKNKKRELSHILTAAAMTMFIFFMPSLQYSQTPNCDSESENEYVKELIPYGTGIIAIFYGQKCGSGFGKWKYNYQRYLLSTDRILKDYTLPFYCIITETILSFVIFRRIYLLRKNNI